MKTVLSIAVILAIVALAFCGYMGAFARVVITEQEEGPFTFAYREMSGNDMKTVGEITTALDTVLGGMGLRDRKPLDVFYPDGRAEIGFSVEGATAASLSGLANGAKVRVIPEQRCMVTWFPWRNPMSFMFGFMKVDPALAKFRADHGYRKVEAYSLNRGDTLIYFQPSIR